ncbi:hypothetical protein PRUPE_1G204300 [Prunus persica]|uniref:Uncharacterized protein n=1 Tax=Prunus persica TaxID=3760 RepID=M5XMG8_PRUPE|nr:hypothetical protein PRUPE_1G204300 [Prunus persica]
MSCQAQAPPEPEQEQVAGRKGRGTIEKGQQRHHMASMTSRFSSTCQVSCSAKPETLNKVCDIVKKQLALPEDTAVTPGFKVC